MAEPQSPTPPTQPPAAAKKKISPWVWVLAGCLVLLVVVLGAMGACGLFVARKAQDFAEEFEANPAKAAAEMAVRLNPELELVETDDDAGTITVRNRRTGEVLTVDFDEMAEGRIRFETDEGESSIRFGDEDGALVVETPEGETRFGSGADVELPDWLPLYPGSSEPQGSYSSTSAGQRSGAVSFTSDDSVGEVLEFYEREFEAAGLEVSKTTFTVQGSEGGSVTGTGNGGQRTASVMVSAEDGRTSIVLNFSDGG